MKQTLLALAYFALCGPSLFAQDQSQQAQVININISRSIQAVNYRAKGSTRIDFRGTALLPHVEIVISGEIIGVKIGIKQGVTQ